MPLCGCSGGRMAELETDWGPLFWTARKGFTEISLYGTHVWTSVSPQRQTSYSAIKIKNLVNNLGKERMLLWNMYNMFCSITFRVRDRVSYSPTNFFSRLDDVHFQNNNDPSVMRNAHEQKIPDMHFLMCSCSKWKLPRLNVNFLIFWHITLKSRNDQRRSFSQRVD